MAGLAVVDRPTHGAIAKGLLQVGDLWTGDTDFQQFAFVNENLKIVPSTFNKSLIPQNCLKPTSLLRSASQTLIIQRQPHRASIFVP